MNSCMTKSIEQIRETNFRNEKRRKERLDFVRNVIKKMTGLFVNLKERGCICPKLSES
jgi:hypothetical protein